MADGRGMGDGVSTGELLDLFPLRSALFPGSRLSLRLFETRYLDLVKRCLKQDEGFAVMPILQGGEVMVAPGARPPALFNIGTYARIVDWQAEADGCLGITVEGCQRVALAGELFQAKDGLLSAPVTWLEEAPCTEPPAQWLRLVSLAEALLQHPLLAPLKIELDDQNTLQVSSVLCQWLPIDEIEKRRLLAMDSVVERIDQLLVLMQELA